MGEAEGLLMAARVSLQEFRCDSEMAAFPLEAFCCCLGREGGRWGGSREDAERLLQGCSQGAGALGSGGVWEIAAGKDHLPDGLDLGLMIWGPGRALRFLASAAGRMVAPFTEKVVTG